MEALVWVFAFIGLWLSVTALCNWLFSARFSPPALSVIFLVKDNQEIVEGLFRQLAIACQFGDLNPTQVTVFDLGSRDQTPAILRLLARELRFLRFREIAEDQVLQSFWDLEPGLLLLDLRRLSATQALAQARGLLRCQAPLFQGQQLPRQGKSESG